MVQQLKREEILQKNCFWLRKGGQSPEGRGEEVGRVLLKLCSGCEQQTIKKVH